MPQSSIFSSEYSRGPLYQYWKERSAEEKATREQRIQEAKLRAKGFQPLSPASGPSSNDSYVRRATSGPPGYITATSGGDDDGNRHGMDEGSASSSSNDAAPAVPGTGSASGRNVAAHEPEMLPPYAAATAATSTFPPAIASASDNPIPSPEHTTENGLLSASEEKARLAQLEAQRRQIESDGALAQTLSCPSHSRPSSAAMEGAGEIAPQTQPRHASIASDGADESPRRKSTTGKIGRWLADAATGYTKRQERF